MAGPVGGGAWAGAVFGIEATVRCGMCGIGLGSLEGWGDTMSWMAEWMYQRLCKAQSDINEHLPTLREYARHCQVVTEFGARRLVSTTALLLGQPKKLVSVDLETPGACGGDLTPLELAAKELGVDFQFVLGNDLEIGIEQTDMLFIDTLHTYDQLKAELAKHAGKVNKYILLHDTTTFGEVGEVDGSIGLWPAVEEFLRDNAWWFLKERFENNNGLTVLERV